MSAAEYCDFSAIRILIIANNQAACTGAELRVVLCSAAVRRVMELLGLIRCCACTPTCPLP